MTFCWVLTYIVFVFQNGTKLKEFDVEANCCAISHENKFIVAAGSYQLTIIDVHTNELIQSSEENCHDGPILCCCISYDDSIIVSGADVSVNFVCLP